MAISSAVVESMLLNYIGAAGVTIGECYISSLHLPNFMHIVKHMPTYICARSTLPFSLVCMHYSQSGYYNNYSQFCVVDYDNQGRRKHSKLGTAIDC